MCRKLILYCVVLLLLCDQASAVQYAYQVSFTNKAGTLTFADSLTFLSARSMARRSAQGIALDSTDLPVSRRYIDSVLTLTGGKMHCISKWLNCCVILLTDSADIHALDGKPYIAGTRLVASYAGILHKGTNNETENDIAARTTAGEAGYYRNTWEQTAIVNGHYLHNLGYKGSGKIIAVVDAGYIGVNTHRGYDSLRSSGRIADEYNFKLDTTHVFGYSLHGSSTLSTMAGYVPDTFVGSAPLASYALYITEDENSEQYIELLNLVSAAERADSLGADIISSSVGYNTFDNGADDFNFTTDFDGHTTIVARAANWATQKGMLFVTSAGNEGATPWNKILTPGDADSALTIGSVGISGIPAATSGYGPNAAGRIKPDVCAKGSTAACFNVAGYTNLDGTSFATPQIAGWAACLWQASPHSTPGQIRAAITRCASQFTSPSNHIGYGIPDFECAANYLNVLDTPFPPTTHGMVRVYPMPVLDVLYIDVTVPSEQSLDFSLCDITGRQVSSFSALFRKGLNLPVAFNLSILPSGMHLLRVSSQSVQQVIKVVRR